jgi:integrase
LAEKETRTMPRLIHSVPKYRRHRASKQAVVTLNGRDHYLGPYGSKASRIEYDRLIGEWLAADRSSLDISGCDLTIIELCSRYRRFATKYYRRNGRDTGVLAGIKSALKYLKPQYGRTLAAAFGPLALKAVRERMIADDLSRRYINDHVDRIRRMFKWAVAEQLLPVEVYQSLVLVPGLRKGRSDARECEPVFPVARGTVDATLPYLPEVVADMVRIQLLTGMRPAELCAIRPCYIDRSNPVWQYRPQQHKTEHFGRERVIFIGPQAQSVLLRYLARDAETCCFRPTDSEAKRRATAHAARRTPLSCGNRPGSNRRRDPKRAPGLHYDVAAYRRAIHRACDRAFPAPEEIKKDAAEVTTWQTKHRWSPNQLRHSAATEVRRRFGLEAAQVILGHSQANITQVYAERDYALAARVAKEVG